MATKLFVNCTNGLSVLCAKFHTPRLYNFEEKKITLKWHSRMTAAIVKQP